MKKLLNHIIICTTLLLPLNVSAQICNSYGWELCIPKELIHQDIQIISLNDKATDEYLPEKGLQSLFLIKKNEKIQLKGTASDICFFMYKGTIEDTMIIEVKYPGYRGGQFVFIKDFHRKLCASISIHLSKEDDYPNEIIVFGDQVEVITNRKTEKFSLSQFKQSEKEDIIQTLCRLPGLKVDKEGLKINDNLITQILINTIRYHTCREEEFQELIAKFRKFSKKR